MSYERGLNFDQWKTFSENYKPMRVWLWLFYKIYRELLSLATFLRVHSNSEEVSYLSWQNTYPNLKTTSHIKLDFFLWTKVLENLILAKYLISVDAPLIVHNLLINYLNLKRVITETAAHRCSAAILKNQKQPLADVLQNRCS